MLRRQSTWHSSLRKAVFILIHNLKVCRIVVVWGIERQSCCIFTEEAEGNGCRCWACFLSLIHAGTSAQIQFPPMQGVIVILISIVSGWSLSHGCSQRLVSKESPDPFHLTISDNTLQLEVIFSTIYLKAYLLLYFVKQQFF